MQFVFIADDDLDDQALLKSAIGEVGSVTDFRFAVHGQDLLDQLKELEEYPDAIFLDLNMPMLNGIETLKLLKQQERFAHIPIVIISTGSSPDTVETVFNLGAVCYIEKPTSFDVLVDRIRLATRKLKNEVLMDTELKFLIN